MDMRTLLKMRDESEFLRTHIIICGVGSPSKKTSKKTSKKNSIKEEQ